MDIIIVMICVIGIWLCLATTSNGQMNDSDISEDIENKFGKK